MNRLLQTFLILITLLSFNQCGPKSNTPDHNNEDRLCIEFKSNRSLFRADNNDPMATLKSVLLLFYSTKNNDSYYLNKKIGLSTTNTNGRLKVDLPKSDYQLVVIGNPTKKISDQFIQGNTYQTLNPWLILPRSELLTEQNGIVQTVLMTNDQGPIKIKSEQFNQNIPIVIQLESLFARVFVTGIPTLPASIYMPNGLNGSYFQLIRSKGSYLMRKLNKLTHNITQEVQGDQSELVNRYAKSPGYEFIASSKTSNEQTEIAAKYRTQTLIKEIYKLDMSTFAPVASSRNQIDLTNVENYQVETTVDPNHHNKLFIPHMCVAYKMCPTSLIKENGFDINNGWAQYKDEVIDGKVLLDYLSQSSLSGLSEQKFQKTSSEFQEAIKQIKQQKTYNIISGTLMPIDALDVKFYSKSTNYYIIPVIHDQNRQTYGRYGVVRNNNYQIIVRKISQFGEPTIPDIINSTEEINQNQDSQIEVGINPITDRTIEIEL